MTWTGGAADQVSCSSWRPALAMLTTNVCARAAQALACALRRVCAVPNCIKNGFSRHPSSTVCRDARCPMLKSVGQHSILLAGCIGSGEEVMLWTEGAHSVAQWFKFPAPALLTSRISLPDGATGPLQQLQLYVCCAHSRSLRACPERVHLILVLHASSSRAPREYSRSRRSANLTAPTSRRLTMLARRAPRRRSPGCNTSISMHARRSRAR